MKKTFKRAGVAVLSMAMLLSMGAMTAISSNAAGEGTIRVVSSSTGLKSTDAVTIYKVANLDSSNHWQWCNGFDGISGIETDFKTISGYSADQTKSLASLLARNAGTVNTGTTYTGDVDANIQIDATKGYYLVLVTTSAADEIVQPILLQVDAGGAGLVSEIKKETIKLEKTITSVTDNKGTVIPGGNLATAADNSVINYLVATSIPKYDAAVTSSTTTLVPFSITDTPDSNLTVDTSSISVFIDTNSNGVADTGETVLSSTTGGDYTVSQSGGSFTVELTKDATITYGGKKIAMKFSATLNTSTVLNATHVYDNTAQSTYGNDYATGGTAKNLTNDADVYSIPLEITKTDSKTNVVMSGVEFTLTDKAHTTNKFYATTNSSGKALFDGIYAGTFTLHETTPSGYKVNADQDITVTFDESTKKWTVTGANYTDPAEKATKAIQNTPQDTLPGTGGMGTVLFTVGGAAIVLLAGVLFVVYMRKRKVEE